MESSQVRAKILVVDDNAENRALAQATLEDEGYEVVLAASGEQAIERFQDERPDCVFLDVRMPGLDGFAVCGRLRALPTGADTPIVFLTAMRDVDTFDRALRAGGDDFLTKPVRPTELVVRAQAALKLRRIGAELRESYDLVRNQRNDLMRLQLQKERLTSFVVHDLKNPVNSMDLLAQLLLRDAELGAPARDKVQKIRDEARSLVRLIMNLLDISKSEEGQLVPQRTAVDLKSTVTSLLESHEVKAQAQGLRLEQDIAVPSLLVDADLLQRVLENLLDNAIRHAPQHTAVRVSASTGEEGIEIRIADQGPGIAAEMREKIFERFIQVESGERLVTRAGRGLGLPFCKLAIEAHGGSIQVEEAHPGTVFCVRLPHGS